MTQALRVLALVALLLMGLALYSTAGPLFHLHTVRVQSEQAWQLRPEIIRAGLRDSGKMSLVFGEFGALTERIQSEPLIRSAQVIKDYPHTLVLKVEVREPVARSATGGLVDRTGEWYAADSQTMLPIFAVKRVHLPQAVALYDDMTLMLEPTGLMINQMRREDHDWRVFLSNGWVLQLGQRKLRARVRRFAASWPRLRGQLATDAHLRFDMRYPNGMAVAGLQDEENNNG